MLSQNIIPTVIAENLCAQLINFQQQIMTRPAAEQFPTQQEVNLQSKLITNIIKINKHNATDVATKAMNEFLRFIKKDDPQLAKAVAEKYAHFIGADPIAIKDVSEPQVKGDVPPFDEACFEQHKHILTTCERTDARDRINCQQRIVNKQWLEYNLFQYCLPPAQRRFIASETTYHDLFNHSKVVVQIKEFLAQKAVMKTAA